MIYDLWIIRGKNAGTFVSLPEAEARPLIDNGDAQVLDGSPLKYPENHPHYGMDDEPAKPKTRKKTTARKKYPNKMMETDSNA